ncbi:hypothetical protein OG890_39700 [Streptomyces anulatus]|uniref:hypothetical protein n=1 Tax=Streptomyces anulatus TaxID=1892 RepID=UPI00225BB53D|nr:hypothetical protein [Streptomyces anulatus]MCX4490013.1 hypothetical protein [Streptomyces anulatus]
MRQSGLGDHEKGCLTCCFRWTGDLRCGNVVHVGRGGTPRPATNSQSTKGNTVNQPLTLSNETAAGGAFATAAKSAAGYLDEAANAHGREKVQMVLDAIGRTRTASHLVEIGPGGGAALQCLTGSLTSTTDRPRPLDVTLIEAPGVISQSLAHAIDRYNASDLGTCTLTHGLAQQIGTILDRPVDIVAASALMHEVYSYGSGYRGIHELMCTLPAVLTPGGHFAYRDVRTVNAPTLHEPVTHTYTHRGWLQFIRMFTPQYLTGSLHPYHRSGDDPTARQDSRRVALESIDPRTSAVVTGPIGLFREIQRHYITFRDYAWRSGVLGFRPQLDGQLSADWIDAAAGHKRVHFTLTETEGVSSRHRTFLKSISEPYGDHYATDGDMFDECTDAALIELLTSAEHGDDACASVWREWTEREGHETYVYLTLSELLSEFAITSAEANTNTVLMPRAARDVRTPERAYYTRYLRTRLPNPLPDGKQMVLFTNIPAHDSQAISAGIETLRPLCSRPAMVRLHSALTHTM